MTPAIWKRDFKPPVTIAWEASSEDNCFCGGYVMRDRNGHRIATFVEYQQALTIAVELGPHETGNNG